MVLQHTDQNQRVGGAMVLDDIDVGVDIEHCFHPLPWSDCADSSQEAPTVAHRISSIDALVRWHDAQMRSMTCGRLLK